MLAQPMPPANKAWDEVMQRAAVGVQVCWSPARMQLVLFSSLQDALGTSVKRCTLSRLCSGMLGGAGAATKGLRRSPKTWVRPIAFCWKAVSGSAIQLAGGTLLAFHLRSGPVDARQRSPDARRGRRVHRAPRAPSLQPVRAFHRIEAARRRPKQALMQQSGCSRSSAPPAAVHDDLDLPMLMTARGLTVPLDQLSE